MASDSPAHIAADIAALDVAIAGDASSAQRALGHVWPPAEEERGREIPEHRELCRQLAALRQRVGRARSELTDPHELRAELATLNFFAQTLRADADRWQTQAHQALEDLARREAAVRAERERLAAERDELLRRRDALQAEIEQAAAAVADGTRGECRRTVPVIQFADAVTVSSITVSTPRRRFRALRLWLITVSEDRDGVLIRRD